MSFFDKKKCAETSFLCENRKNPLAAGGEAPSPLAMSSSFVKSWGNTDCALCL